MASPVNNNSSSLPSSSFTYVPPAHLLMPAGIPPPPPLQMNTGWRPAPQKMAGMPWQGIRQGQLPADRVSNPHPEPKAENVAPSERSTSWSTSKGISLMGTSLSLKGGMQKVMESGEYSDLAILCEDRKFSVHKVVVCSQSKVLAAAMKKGFKESELNVIDLSDDGILPISNLITFLYTGNYPAKAATSCVSDPTAYYQCIHQLHDIAATSRVYGTHPSNVHSSSKEANTKVDSPNKSPNYSLEVEMYALSDQYDVPALGALAKSRLDAICTVNWNPQSFLEIVPRVYESTLESNRGFRTVVLDHARKHSNDFMKDELLKTSFNGLLAATPEFGTALLNNYMSASPPSLDNAVICAGCGQGVNRYHHKGCEGLGGIFHYEGSPEPYSTTY